MYPCGKAGPPTSGPRNGDAAAKAIQELGFPLTPQQALEIRQQKDFVQLKHGPFDVDLVFAPDGMEQAARRQPARHGVRGPAAARVRPPSATSDAKSPSCRYVCRNTTRRASAI